MEEPRSKEGKEDKFLIIMVDSGVNYVKRRRAIRRSWLRYLTDPSITFLTPEQKKSVLVLFVLGEREGVSIEEEQKRYNDIVQLPVQDSYDTIARKTLLFMEWIRERYTFTHFMHADDDSFIRLDYLLPILYKQPTTKLYWGYIWDNNDQEVFTKNNMVKHRVTRPLRTPTAKSYMPFEQYSLDSYPPFACGCGFVLTADLIDYLVNNAHLLKDYRLVDVAFGIYLHPIRDIQIVNDDRVRPYKPLPTFCADTVIQHYLQPEEFAPFFAKAINKSEESEQDLIHKRILGFYDNLADMGLMKK